MRYNYIYNLDDLKAYCKKVCSGTKYFSITHPHSTPHTPNHLLELHSNNSKALGYRLFETPITYNKVSLIRGVIYSYYTPIGLILDTSLVICNSKELPFKSITTKRIATMLNRNNYKLSLQALKRILLHLNIELGWLE